MRGKGQVGSIVIVIAFVLLVWGVTRILGFRMSLGFSLIASVVLTIVLNLILRAVGSKD